MTAEPAARSHELLRSAGILLSAIAGMLVLDLLTGLICTAAYARQNQVSLAWALVATTGLLAIGKIAVASGCAFVSAFVQWRLRQHGMTVRRRQWFLSAALGTCALFGLEVGLGAHLNLGGRCVGRVPVLAGPADIAFGPHNHEPAYEAHIDEAGVRGAPPQAGAHWLIGDSFVFGCGLGEQATIARQLQEMLHTPVVNAGLPGDNLHGAIFRADRWLTVAKPAAIWLVVMAADEEPAAPWLDCDLPAFCHLLHGTFSLPAAIDSSSLGFVEASVPAALPERLRQTRNDLMMLAKRAREQGVFLGVIRLTVGSSHLRGTLQDQPVDAYRLADCLGESNRFAREEHTNQRGAACIAQTIADAWNTRDGKVHFLEADEPDARCASPEDRGVLRRLRQSDQFVPVNHDPCAFEFTQTVKATPVRVRLKIGAKGNSFVPFAAGVVEINPAGPLESADYASLRDTLTARMAEITPL